MKALKCLFMMLLVAVCVALPVNGADEKSKHSEADYQVAYSMLEAMNMPEMFQKISDGIAEMLIKSNPLLNQYKAVLKDFYAKCFTYEALKKDYADIYLDEFTIDELKELTLFYKTPIGRKLAMKSSEISLRGAEIGQKVALQHLDELQEALKKATSESQSKK